VTGSRIVVLSWASIALYAVVTGLDTLGVTAFEDVAPAVCVGLFLVSLGVWTYAFGLAVVRTGRGDDIAVASLFFLSGSAPSDVRKHLLGATVASIVIAALTAAHDPYSVLVPMLPLGMAGLWGARHGTFPPRKPPTAARSTPRRGASR
jgi:hypothetical protein